MYSCVHVYLLFLLFLLILLQAISHPSSDAHQDKAWQKVCPLVLRLRSYYEYAQELETVLNEILNTICSPEMTALEHLEKQQVRHSVHTLYMYYCPVRSMHIRLSIRLCLFVSLFVCNQKKTLAGQVSLQKRCILLSSTLYMYVTRDVC